MKKKVDGLTVVIKNSPAENDKPPGNRLAVFERKKNPMVLHEASRQVVLYPYTVAKRIVLYSLLIATVLFSFWNTGHFFNLAKPKPEESPLNYTQDFANLHATLRSALE